MTTFVLGTHNLHDEAGIPTMFADVVGFTEAIPHTIEDELSTPRLRDRAARAARHLRLRVTGHAVIVCRQQPDLVVVLRRRLFKVQGRSYTQYVKGRAKVTPNRGTFVVLTKHRATRTPVAFVFEHRINAAFPPFTRGEASFRRAAWERHTKGTCETIRRLIDSRYVVAAGGDLNTPADERGYAEAFLHERGPHFDRLGSSVHIGKSESLSAKGSDHKRLRATVRL